MGSWGQIDWGLVVVEVSFSWDKVYKVCYGYLMYVFMSILTPQRDIMSFSRVSSDCLCMAPLYYSCNGNKGLTFHHVVFNI